MKINDTMKWKYITCHRNIRSVQTKHFALLNTMAGYTGRGLGETNYRLNLAGVSYIYKVIYA